MTNIFGISQELLGAILDGAFLPALLHPLGVHTEEGHGKPVLFIPGFGGSDRSLEVLRLRLKQRDFRVYPSGITNNGNFSQYRDMLVAKVRSIAEETGERVSLVGHSLGGRFACHIADEIPSVISSIVTLGTPFNKREMNALASMVVSEALTTEMSHRCHLPQRVPLTVIVAEWDAIVPVEEAILTELELRPRYRSQVQVPTTHLGLPFSSTVADMVAERLCQSPSMRRPEPAPVRLAA